MRARRAARSAGGGHLHFHEEAVAGGGGQLEGFFPLDPVAVGEHLEMGKMPLGAEGGDRALGHQPQQQRMDLRPGAVDLVEEEDGQVRPRASAAGRGRCAGGPSSPMRAS